MARYNDDGPGLFSVVFRLLLVVVLLGALGLLAFAFVGDLSRAPQPRSLPVDLPQE